MWGKEWGWTPVRYCTERETSTYTKFWAALIVIGIIWGWTKICDWVSNETFADQCPYFIAPLYLSIYLSIYLSLPKDFKQLHLSGVALFKKISTFHFTYNDQYFLVLDLSKNCADHNSHCVYIYIYIYIYIDIDKTWNCKECLLHVYNMSY